MTNESYNDKPWDQPKFREELEQKYRGKIDPTLRPPGDWLTQLNPHTRIVAPDGWRSPYDQPIQKSIGMAEFVWRLSMSTVERLPHDDE